MFGVVVGLAALSTILSLILMREWGRTGRQNTISEPLNPPPEPPSLVTVRMEFWETLLLRSLHLDRPSPQGGPSPDWVMQAEDERATRPSWEEKYPLPMEQALAREVEETRIQLLDYQNRYQEEYPETGYEEQYQTMDYQEDFLASFSDPPEPSPPTT